MQTAGLDEEITDVYIPAADPMSGFSFPDKKPFPESCRTFIQGLLEACLAADRKVFSIRYEGIKFRAQLNETFDGKVFCLRRMANQVRPLSECSFDSRIQDVMLSPRMCRGGLVIISGSPGMGKSTTCAAIIRQRLKTFGGMCFTVEDPVELPLQGDHDNGFCLQHQVDSRESFPEAMRDSLRSYPTQVNNMMMLVGEVRDAETAALVLQAAVDGRLVFTTLHASSVTDAIFRMLSLSAKVLGSDEARSIMSAGLRMVVHQRLVTREGVAQRLLNAEVLLDTTEVVSKIRSRGTPINLLQDDIRLQQNLIRKDMQLNLRET